mgnify:CR=1 FL=1
MRHKSEAQFLGLLRADRAVERGRGLACAGGLCCRGMVEFAIFGDAGAAG